MRLLGFLSSIVVVLSFILPWFRIPVNGGVEEITFLAILEETLGSSNGLEGAFWWLNPESVGTIFLFIVFFTGMSMILAGILFGLLGGRTGPGIGVVGVFIITLVAWHVYGEGFFEVLGEGYIIALLSFVVGFIWGGGKAL